MSISLIYFFTKGKIIQILCIVIFNEGLYKPGQTIHLTPVLRRDRQLGRI